LRLNRMACGYCGHQYERAEMPADGFCNNCIDSEYLKTEDLRLLRLESVAQRRRLDFGLSDFEAGWPTQRYRKAQQFGATARGKARLAKRRKEIEEKRRDSIKHAEAEYAAMTWLMDHAPNLEANAIYYSHLGVVGFGWRSKIDKALVDDMVKALHGFPVPWQIETNDGRRIKSTEAAA